MDNLKPEYVVSRVKDHDQPFRISTRFLLFPEYHGKCSEPNSPYLFPLLSSGTRYKLYQFIKLCLKLESDFNICALLDDRIPIPIYFTDAIELLGIPTYLYRLGIFPEITLHSKDIYGESSLTKFSYALESPVGIVPHRVVVKIHLLSHSNLRELNISFFPLFYSRHFDENGSHVSLLDNLSVTEAQKLLNERGYPRFNRHVPDWDKSIIIAPYITFQIPPHSYTIRLQDGHIMCTISDGQYEASCLLPRKHYNSWSIHSVGLRFSVFCWDLIDHLRVE